MGILVTLVDYTPPARADSTSYTSVKIEEATEAAGPWSIIDTKSTGPDADPAHPEARDLTTNKATLTAGFYRVKWVSGADETAPSEPVQNLASLAGGLRPTIVDVAAKLRARTKTVGGDEIGTFNQNTRPTDDEVEALINEALDEVLGKIKTPTSGSDYERRARGAVALYAAILVETSYFPEQVGSGKSAAATYEKLYDSRIKALIAEGETGEPEGMGDSDAPADASWTFPESTSGLVGWGSRW
jgi:hypothetical protein